MPTEKILFLTGHLAEPRLSRMLKGLGETEFEWQVLDIGVKVAALMTEAIITRRLPRPSCGSDCPARSRAPAGIR